MARWTGAGGRSLLRVDSAVSEGAHDRSPLATSHTPDRSVTGRSATRSIGGGTDCHSHPARTRRRRRHRRAATSGEGVAQHFGSKSAFGRHRHARRVRDQRRCRWHLYGGRGPRRLSDGSMRAATPARPDGASVSSGRVVPPRHPVAEGHVLAGTITNPSRTHRTFRVEALEFRYPRGRRIPVQAASATTNDLGTTASPDCRPALTWFAHPRPDTWQDDEGKNALTYAHTYFPGVTGFDQAQLLNLGVGKETGEINFAMRPRLAATITGVIRNADGEGVASQSIHAVAGDARRSAARGIRHRWPGGGTVRSG